VQAQQDLDALKQDANRREELAKGREFELRSAAQQQAALNNLQRQYQAAEAKLKDIPTLKARLVELEQSSAAAEVEKVRLEEANSLAEAALSSKSLSLDLMTQDLAIKVLDMNVLRTSRDRVARNVDRLNERLKLHESLRDKRLVEQRAEIDRLTLEVAQLPVVQAELEEEKDHSKRAKEDAAAALRQCQDELSHKDTTLTAQLEAARRDLKATKSECAQLSAFKAKHLSCKNDISTLESNIKVKNARIAELEKEAREQTT